MLLGQIQVAGKPWRRVIPALHFAGERAQGRCAANTWSRATMVVGTSIVRATYILCISVVSVACFCSPGSGFLSTSRKGSLRSNLTR